MKKIVICLAVLTLALNQAKAIIYDFQTGFTDGDLGGQAGFNLINSAPTFEVDVAGAGSLTPNSSRTNGFVTNALSDAELGGVFDNTSSILEYGFVFDTTTHSGGFSPNVTFRLGSFGFSGNVPDLEVILRSDGRIAYRDSNGLNTPASPQWTENASNTLTVTLDYATDTYDIALNDSSFATGDFAISSQQAAVFRMDHNFTSTPNFSFDSISVAIVPEPSMVSLLVGGSGLLLLMRRKRS